MSDSVFDVINRRFVSGNSTCVERAHVTQPEWQELTRIQSEVGRLRGRYGELECKYQELLAEKNFIGRKGLKALFLRKQAEALDSEATSWLGAEGRFSSITIEKEILDHAAMLRQQADELEKGNN